MDDCSSTNGATAQQAIQTTHPQGLSKKAQKRAAKAARLHELKLERRAREREAKKRKRQERAKAVDNDAFEASSTCKRRRTNPFGNGSRFQARLVVDLGFDELMTDKEINSLTSQLAYSYSANRRAPCSFSSVLFTSLGGKTKQRLDAMNDAGYRRWSNTEWWEDGYEHIWTKSMSDGVASTTDARGNVVYLTADSEYEISELREGETYIIGGICDHNRYKNLCLNKANASQIRHARLPIGRYIALATRKVLTVNQVVQILLKWIETRNWEDAFWTVIPKRKFQGAQRVNLEGDDEMKYQSEHSEDHRGDEITDKLEPPDAEQRSLAVLPDGVYGANETRNLVDA